MRKAIASLIIAGLLSVIAVPTTSAATLLTSSPAASSKKHRVRKPRRAPGASSHEGATAECRDGSYSYSANHRGTCSHHGGVKRWFK